MPLLKSFGYAFQGIWAASKGRNMRIHLLATVLVVAAAWFYQISGVQLAILLICIGVVLSAEAFNTAIELACDLMTEANSLRIPDHGIKTIKDVAAGAVLTLAMIAGVVALVIIGPHIWAAE